MLSASSQAMQLRYLAVSMRNALNKSRHWHNQAALALACLQDTSVNSTGTLCQARDVKRRSWQHLGQCQLHRMNTWCCVTHQLPV